MMKLVRKLWGDRRGVALVEFAIALPVLIFMAAGIWEFGRIYDAYLVATNAAREGARWAALGYSETSVQNRVMAYVNDDYGQRIANGELTMGTVTRTLLSDPANGYPTPGEPGAPVLVNVPVAVTMYMPGVLGLGDTINLNGQATMQLQTRASP